jgi:hypothetical protein
MSSLSASFVCHSSRYGSLAQKPGCLLSSSVSPDKCGASTLKDVTITPLQTQTQTDRLEDSRRRSSKEGSREGQVKMSPAEGRAKKTPEGQIMKIPVEGWVKKTPERVRLRRLQ